MPDKISLTRNYNTLNNGMYYSHSATTVLQFDYLNTCTQQLFNEWWNEKRAGIISSFDNTPRRNYEEANLWSSDPPEVAVERFRKSLSYFLLHIMKRAAFQRKIKCVK